MQPIRRINAWIGDEQWSTVAVIDFSEGNELTSLPLQNTSYSQLPILNADTTSNDRGHILHGHVDELRINALHQGRLPQAVQEDSALPLLQGLWLWGAQVCVCVYDVC